MGAGGQWVGVSGPTHLQSQGKEAGLESGFKVNLLYVVQLPQEPNDNIRELLVVNHMEVPSVSHTSAPREWELPSKDPSRPHIHFHLDVHFHSLK